MYHFISELVKNSNLIFLWGMPGCGKTYCGRKAAEILQVDFIDFDEAISTLHGMNINRIFKELGESAFRNFEKELLHQMVSTINIPSIIATGGGTPCFFNNADVMNAHGHTIYYEVPLSVIKSRIPNLLERPLLYRQPDKQLDRMYQSRCQMYEKAKHKVVYVNDDCNSLILKMRSLLFER